MPLNKSLEKNVHEASHAAHLSGKVRRFRTDGNRKKKKPTTILTRYKKSLRRLDFGDGDSVYVMSVEEGVHIAGMGGLMGMAMRRRNISGAVIDGGVPEVAYLNKIGFPVYALGLFLRLRFIIIDSRDPTFLSFATVWK